MRNSLTRSRWSPCSMISPPLDVPPHAQKAFSLCAMSCEIGGFLVHAVNYGGRSAKFSGFKTYANSLLFFFYFATNTQVFWKSTSCTNFSHDFLVLALDKAIYKTFKTGEGVSVFGFNGFCPASPILFHFVFFGIYD